MQQGAAAGAAGVGMLPCLFLIPFQIPYAEHAWQTLQYHRCMPVLFFNSMLLTTNSCKYIQTRVCKYTHQSMRTSR